jgi:hypothetical protein
MSKHYRQVSIEEGLPEKEDWYMTDKGPCEFLPKDEDGPDVWFDRRSYKVAPKWWIDHTKELPSTTHVLTEEELMEKIKQERFEAVIMAYDSILRMCQGLNEDEIYDLIEEYRLNAMQQHLKDKEDGK